MPRTGDCPDVPNYPQICGTIVLTRNNRAPIFNSQTGRKRRAVGTDKATKEAQSERANR